MANEIIFVGAGPIGLWTAIQIKLQRPDIDIIFKEKKDEYKRTHTLLLKPTSFDDCLKDESGIIQGIINELKENPHIRTNELEQRLKNLAIQLGVRIDKRDIQTIESDILADHPDATMIIGSDGVKSPVRNQIFGAENTERVTLAYAAQIKYSVKGPAVQASELFEAYPLLKKSNYLASINVGKLKNDKTPVTIQFVIDKETYDKISHATYAQPIRLLADSLEEQLPPELLKDVKTHIGFRLSNGEDIIINDINLTASELPQQRCKQVTTIKDERYYGVIGDAALALSYFKGMNTGLQLATKFSKAIVTNWDKVVDNDATAFDDYKKVYDEFATAAFKRGHETNRFIGKVVSAIQVGAALPFQFLYFDDNTIADFHRCFDIYHQVCQFYIDSKLTESFGVPSARNIKSWLESQMIHSYGYLKARLISLANNYNESHSHLHKALTKLANLDPTKLDFYDKAYLGLAISKTITLLEEPTQENYQACLKLANRLKTVNSSFVLLMSSIVELIIGIIALAFGIVALVSTAGAAAPYAAPLIGMGGLLAGHGIYKLQKNLQSQGSVYNALEKVIEERRKLNDGSELATPISTTEKDPEVEVEVEVEVDIDGPIDLGEFENVPLVSDEDSEEEPDDVDSSLYRGVTNSYRGMSSN